MKIQTVIVGLTFLCSSLFATTVSANAGETVNLSLAKTDSDLVVTIKGGSLDGQNFDAKIVNGSLYINGGALVFLFSDSSYTSNPDTHTDTIVLSEIVTVNMYKNCRVEINGEPLDLNEVVMKELESGYVPVRKVFELAGYTVNYKVSSDRLVTISTDKR